jgi:phosphopantetheinyl transferase (holo-ACP synthase)
VWIRDIGVVHNAWGKPEVIYSKRGERVRRRLGIGEGHVTLTDEAGLIVAVAILMRARRVARRRAAPVRRRTPKAPRSRAAR